MQTDPSVSSLLLTEPSVCVWQSKEQAALLPEPPFCQLSEIWLWLNVTAEAELACKFSLKKQNRCGWRWAGGGTGGPNQHSLLFAHSHTPALSKKGKKKIKELYINEEQIGTTEHIWILKVPQCLELMSHPSQRWKVNADCTGDQGMSLC